MGTNLDLNGIPWKLASALSLRSCVRLKAGVNQAQIAQGVQGFTSRPSVTQWTLLGGPEEQVQETVTSICRGFAASALGSRRVRTPYLSSAEIFSWVTDSESSNCLKKFIGSNS